MSDSPPDQTSLPLDVQNFRLVLSDALVEGGQVVKTFPLSSADVSAMSIKSVTDRLNRHFGFAKIAAERNLETDSIQKGTPGIALIGNDGARHIPIRSDEQLVAFFKSIRNSKFPSLELRLWQPGAPHKPAASEAPCTERRAPQDRVEELEDVNFRTSKATQKLQMSMDELERSALASKEEAQRLVSVASRELGAKIDANHQVYLDDSKSMKDTAEKMKTDSDAVSKAMHNFEKHAAERDENMTAQVEELNVRMKQKFEDWQTSIDTLAEADDELGTENERISAELKKQGAELKRLNETKVQQEELQSVDDSLSKRLTDEISALKTLLESTVEDLNSRMSKQQKELTDMFNAVKGDFTSTTTRIDTSMKKMDEDVKNGITTITENIGVATGALEKSLKQEISTVSARTDAQFEEVSRVSQRSDKDMNERMEELTARVQATFEGLEVRMESLCKAERSRLGNIERDLTETTATLRSDCRSEVERVRADYEEQAARLDADMSDLHTKHDVVKQEMDFFQTRLLEQRDWSQRQLAENATAVRAAQVDSQEGLAAATRMAHALRDDQVSFRDKMGKHISLLQHASDSYGDAINSLETQRSRMRLELDAVLQDHTSYVTDMDDWANDVRDKVERLFRAMEPPRCVWKIGDAMDRVKDLKKPLSMRSPTFALQGLRQVQLELYPHGTNQSPDGKAVLRLCMPPNSNVRYQCWLGRLTEGSREYESNGSLTVDLQFESYRDQIMDDGSLVVSMEILQDLTNDDESLARAVHIET